MILLLTGLVFRVIEMWSDRYVGYVVHFQMLVDWEFRFSPAEEEPSLMSILKDFCDKSVNYI